MVRVQSPIFLNISNFVLRLRGSISLYAHCRRDQLTFESKQDVREPAMTVSMASHNIGSLQRRRHRPLNS